MRREQMLSVAGLNENLRGCPLIYNIISNISNLNYVNTNLVNNSIKWARGTVQ